MKCNALSNSLCSFFVFAKETISNFRTSSSILTFFAFAIGFCLLPLICHDSSISLIVNHISRIYDIWSIH